MNDHAIAEPRARVDGYIGINLTIAAYVNACTDHRASSNPGLIADLGVLADDGSLSHAHVPAQPRRSMDDRGGMGPGMPLRRGTKKLCRSRKPQPGMFAYQQGLAISLFFRIRSPGKFSRNDRSSSRSERRPQTLFVFDKHQIRRSCLGNAGNSTDFDRAISHHLRLQRLGNRKE